MVKVVPLDHFAYDNQVAYGGAAGRKRAVHIGTELWMLKFPESTKEFPGRERPGNHLPSYTTSPLSEYIGSHVYQTLGIPVHDTFLGIREGKVVVACKDFADRGRITDFASIKNMMDDDDLEHGTSSNGRGDYLSDVLRVIHDAPILDGMRDEVLERFWDMFVVDAFILNNDRNNGNWGLMASGSKMVLTPVYDNGQAFFNKKGNSLMEHEAHDQNAVWSDVKSSLSFYLDIRGSHIKPFDFLAITNDKDAVAALGRFVDHIDFDAVAAIITSIPQEEHGITVFPQAAQDFYVAAAVASLARGILPAARAQGIGIPHRLQALETRPISTSKSGWQGGAGDPRPSHHGAGAATKKILATRDDGRHLSQNKRLRWR